MVAPRIFPNIEFFIANEKFEARRNVLEGTRLCVINVDSKLILDFELVWWFQRVPLAHLSAHLDFVSWSFL